MKREAKYTEAPKDVREAIMQSEVIEDFLPPPEELILKEETVKVTISLSKRSVDFFRRAAKAQGIPYQSMIRKVLDLYTRHYRRG